MGILEKLKEQRKANKMSKTMAQAEREDIIREARPVYHKAMVKEAKKALVQRAKREAMNRYGYTKQERRQRTMSNIGNQLGGLQKELGSIGNWAVGNESRQKRTTKGKHKAKKKASNPFDMGDLDELMW